MKDCIKHVLFGNQKQAKRQNEAIVNFMEEYLAGKDTSTEESTVHAIKTMLKETGAPKTLEQRLFAEYVLGVDGAKMLGGEDIEITDDTVGAHGKHVFYVTHGTVTSTPKVTPESGTSEDDTWVLVRKILSTVPPFVRSKLPEDDALAAVAVSQEYWKAVG